MKFLTFTVVVRVVVAIVHHCVSSVLDVFFPFLSNVYDGSFFSYSHLFPLFTLVCSVFQV